jgi:hypothetical protein
MEQLRDICQGEGCGKLDLIVNKHFYLCEECNYKRLHHGKTKQEVYRERHDKKVREIPKELPKIQPKAAIFAVLKKTFSIKKMSNKRAQRHRERDKAYVQIDQERPPVCEGCGFGGGTALSHSHILSEQRRPDLYADKDNIRLHCYGQYNTCHEKWERGLIYEVVLMLDFKENLEYIKSVDSGEYNKIVANAEFNNIKI